MSYKMARRSFLRGCGGSAALLLPLLRSIEARAQGMAAPLRLLVLHHPLGASPGLGTWRPAATATTTSFTLPLESAPFAPLQSKMVMIDGLNLITASKAAGNSGGQNTHEGGMVALMTGVPALGQIGQQDHCAGGPSIEQLLLARSPTLGGAGSPANKQTMFGSLQLAADIRSDRDEIAPRVLSYLPPTSNPDINQARQPQYAETEPLTTFTRIFGGALPTGTNTAALLANRLSILDFMRSDLARMQSLVPSSEKPKLDVHATAIQQLESSIRATLGPANTGSTCTKPAAPAYFTQSGMGASTSSGLAPRGRKQAQRRRLLFVERPHQSPPPGAGSGPSVVDPGRVRLRSGAHVDVHVVVGDQLGGISRHVQRRHHQGQSAIDAAPSAQSQ